MSQSRIICQGKDKLKIWNVDFQGNGKQNKVLHVSLQVSLSDVKVINCSDSGSILIHFIKILQLTNNNSLIVKHALMFGPKFWT